MEYMIGLKEVSPSSTIELGEGEIALNSFYDSTFGTWKVVVMTPKTERAETEGPENEEKTENKPTSSIAHVGQLGCSAFEHYGRKTK